MAHITQFNRPYGLKEMTVAKTENEKGVRETCCPRCHCDPCCCEQQVAALKAASKSDLERVLHERHQCALRTVDTDRIQEELNNRR